MSGGTLTASVAGHTGHAGSGAGVVHAADAPSNNKPMAGLESFDDNIESTAMDAGLLLILLEAGLALGMFVFIIWWTLPKKDKSDKK
ncbi:MAG TPA: hypothetical protein VJU83_11635 [Burkholderiales bacterium]|nr:hypothetical protein [Burkholderiales bacterium]